MRLNDAQFSKPVVTFNVLLCQLGRMGELWQKEGACSRVYINYLSNLV